MIKDGSKRKTIVFWNCKNNLFLGKLYQSFYLLTYLIVYINNYIDINIFYLNN